jgi:hypothetical protein
MKYSLTLLGFAASAYAAPAIGNISPKGGAPDGCSTSYDGKFEVSIFKVSEKRSLEKRACSGEGALVLTLADGILKDSKDRTGYVASNYQFQFDGPPQAGAIYTDGFSTCSNGSLALGSSTTFYQCLSGDFYNLYDRHWAAQCEPVDIVAMACDGGSGSGSGSGGDVTQVPDGQVVGSSMVVTTIVTVLSDGQPQAVPTTIAIPLCQIGDGQVQGHTTPCAQLPPVTQITDGQIQVPPTAPPAPPVSQISDGQPQAPTTTVKVPPITQISDGQPQAPTSTAPPAPPVTQISDGQPQAPTSTAPPAPPVTQISDGQPQAPTSTAPAAPPVTQISDGQVQAPTTGAVVTQITDGQIQAPTTVPAANTSVPTTAPSVPPSSGNKMIPGTTGALLVAFLGAFLYL